MKIFAAAAMAVLLVLLAACQKKAEDTSADEAAIANSGPEWAAALNAGDADKMAGMYWEDAVIQPPGASSAEGREAIRDFLAAEISNAKAAGMTMNIPKAGKIDVSGDLAYEAGTYSVSDASGATVDTGKYLGVFQKRNGKWLYVRDTWNSDTAPTAAAAPEPAAEEPAAK